MAVCFSEEVIHLSGPVGQTGLYAKSLNTVAILKLLQYFPSLYSHCLQAEIKSIFNELRFQALPLTLIANWLGQSFQMPSQ